MRVPARLGAATLAALLSGGFCPLPAQVTFAESTSEDSSEVRELPATVAERLEQDLAAMAAFRPGYSFWQHIFQIPDGSVAFGSAVDGTLVVTFPSGGDWTRNGRWADPSLARAIEGRRLHSRQNLRRDEVATYLEPVAGPVMHNATRGDFLRPNARRYGAFLDEWATIYERFGVPGEIGLAQAAIESGWNGRIRSEARALGMCQWLPGNWERLKRLSPHVIEGYNQTTQAPYCAAYLTVLATKYGSFVPALSEHHAGGTNVGRALINGARLGGEAPRDQYFLGGELLRDLRAISMTNFREVVRTYGPRSFVYAEMVFGNTHTVRHFRETIPQERIYAMRTPRAIPIAEITRRTGISADEVRRFNPALVRQVPAGANLYLPMQVEGFGADASFWHHEPDPAYIELLEDFLALPASPEVWDDRSFEPVLRGFRERFRSTGTEEGAIMATMLGYVMQEAYTSRRADILSDYRSSPRILSLVERGVRERDEALAQASRTAR